MGKAKTKAGKLRVKRGVGRPRSEDIIYREPSGRRSRSVDPVDRLATEIRAKKLGLTVIEARDADAGTYIGRLYMQHKAWEQRGSSESRRPVDSLTYRQHEAAKKYRALHNDYLKAVGAPGAIYEGVPGSGGDDDASAKWAASVKESYGAARVVIQDAQAGSRSENLWAALDYAVLRDEEFPHMIGALRILCNALAHHWKIN